jgi:hypothetical protein
MKYKIEFQYLGQNASRPDDYVQEVNISSDDCCFIPIPAVGDSVSVALQSEDLEDYEVLTRHFTYTNGFCCVNIVVTDLPPDEMAKRLKM